MSAERVESSKAGLEAIFKIYHLVIFQAKKDGAPGVVFFSFFLGFVFVFLLCLYLYLQAKEYQGVATSKLVYKPDIGDDGRYLACRVLPTSKAGKSLEDTWEIKVLCESEFVSQNHFSISLRPLTQNLFLKSLRVCSQNKGSLAPPRQMNFPKNHLFWWSSAFLNQINLFKTQPKKDENLFSDKPQVSLRLGASLDPDNLRTGGSQ